MRRSFLFLFLAFWFALPASAQLRKDRLFKVDPASGLFKEFRVAMEHRWRDSEWWGYAAPFGYYQNWFPKRNVRAGRPGVPQKYFGAGTRLGVRKYFSGDSPKGLYVSGMAGYRYNWVNIYSTELAFVQRDRFHSVGVGGTVGWQELYGRKDNLAYGAHVGLEYYRNYGSRYRQGEYVRNWYEFAGGFRLFIGVELGFAFLQKRLHW